MKVIPRSALGDRPNGLIGRLNGLPPGSPWVGFGLLLAAVLFTGWLGFGAYQAKSNLEQARASANQTKDALLSDKAEDATRFAENTQSYARQARAATHSLPWNIAAEVPLLGSPLKTTQQISDVVLGLADDVLLPATRMGADLSPDKLIDGTRINLQRLREAEPRLSELSASATKLDAEAQAIHDPRFVSLLRDARSQLQGQTTQLAQVLSSTAIAARLAPSMLGGDGPRTYLMAFQTPAEARGTGGLVGGLGTLRFENGSAAVDTLAPNTELTEATANIDLGSEFNRGYGWMNPYTDFRNSNLSPHFPYAAQIWKSMWENRTGKTVNGVIAVDPVALSYILGALGPITMPDGEIISGQNVVELTMSTAYARFPPEYKYFSNGDVLALPDRRKLYLQQIASETVKKLTGKVQSPEKVLAALGRAAGEGRIAVWSANPIDQEILEETPLAHVIPQGPAPYAQVVINNIAGNKMDYYLSREIEYVADGCDGEIRNSTVTVRLANTAPDKPLPEQVGGSTGLGDGTPINLPNGTMLTSVRIIGTPGARMMSVTANGERTTATMDTERGHPSFEVQVAIPTGQSGELVFRLTEPTLPGKPEVPIQPLIDTVTPLISVPECR